MLTPLEVLLTAPEIVLDELCDPPDGTVCVMVKRIVSLVNVPVPLNVMEPMLMLDGEVTDALVPV